MRFLAIGECMAELSPADAPQELRLGFAGDTFNTAWYLARCAPFTKVSYYTVIGEDAISADLRAFMRASGIDDRCVTTSAAQTIGLYLISLSNGERSFTYWRGQSAARLLADDPAAMAQAMAQADVIYFSGITLGILAPEKRTALLKALRDARAAGKTIAFDPNLRPKLWNSGQEMTSEIMRGAAVSDLVMPSFEDEAEWFGDADPQGTAQRYQAAGGVTVVVKNGPDSVFYAEKGAMAEVSVSPLGRVVDSTAAGDSFNAGLFVGHALGQSLDQGIRYACALSREVIGARGALVPVDPSTLPVAC